VRHVGAREQAAALTVIAPAIQPRFFGRGGGSRLWTAGI